MECVFYLEVTDLRNGLVAISFPVKNRQWRVSLPPLGLIELHI